MLKQCQIKLLVQFFNGIYNAVAYKELEEAGKN